MRILMSLIVLLLSVPAFAQMHVVVESDRVVIGAEYLPRCPSVLPGGVLSPGTYDCVENSGTLTLGAGVYRIVTLINLPGATVQIGTGAEVIIRDVALSASDVHQWGNGLVNFGRIEILGGAKRAWSNATADLATGATSITVQNADSWAVGDALLIPDTAEPARTNPGDALSLRRETPVTIAAIAGTTITLSKPLDFAHPSVRLPDGAVVKTPYVANLTRSVVIRSENPNGTRGHTANVGHDASWDIRGAMFVDLGRTKAETLDPVSNHIGRYSAHNHHANGLDSRFVGNTFIRGTKWGLATHSTSDSLVAMNVGVDFPGGCFSTEDGNEYRNTFDQNLCAYSVGAAAFNNPLGHANANCPGCEGAGGWFRGLQNTFTGNVFLNNRLGISAFNAPIVPVTEMTPATSTIRGNVTIANQFDGVEFWFMPCVPVADHLAAHNPENLFSPASSPANTVCLSDVTLVGSGPQSIGFAGGRVYTFELQVDGGIIAGHELGISEGGARYVTLKNLTLQNATNIDMNAGGVPESFLSENVTHLPFQGGAHRYIVFGPETAPTAAELNASSAILFNGYPNPPMLGDRMIVRSHQGVSGADFFLYQKGQLRTDPISIFGTSEQCGTTQGSSWDACGIAVRGTVLDASQATTTFDGLINGMARVGSTPMPLGTPAAILTFPNRLAPPDANVPTLRFIQSGARTDVHPDWMIAYKGPTDLTFSDPFALGPIYSSDGGETRGWYAPNSLGEHQFKTWMLHANGSMIAGSERVFSYCLPSCETMPPPPVDCVVSAFTLTSAGEWGMCVNGLQSRAELWSRTILTPPSNGGSACPALTEIRTGTQACTVPPAWTIVPSTTERNGDQIRICIAGPLCTAPMPVSVP